MVQCSYEEGGRSEYKTPRIVESIRDGRQTAGAQILVCGESKENLTYARNVDQFAEAKVSLDTGSTGTVSLP